jgi:tRNA G10  N-methylase Trm11
MPILTAHVGTNADVFPHILALYVPEGSVIADVTYGRGVFWRHIEVSKYDLRATDLLMGVDFRSLPYPNASIDCLAFDPPYVHGGQTMLPSLRAQYRNDNGVHESVMRLYGAGILEAARVLKPKKGIIIVKTQDEIESGKQRLSHLEVTQLLQLFGFEVMDLFVLVQSTLPAMRQSRQQHARKNHSFYIVARFRG